MKAVRKTRWKIVGILAGVLLFLFQWQCANPVNQPPLRWAQKIDVPMMNDSFYLAQKMQSLFSGITKDTINILNSGRDSSNPGVMYSSTNPDSLHSEYPLGADTVKGDTAIFSVLRRDSTLYDITQDSMADKTFHPRLGPIPLANVPIIGDTLSVTDSFNTPVTIPLSGIYAVTFDTSSPQLSVSVANLSSSATVNNLAVTVFGTTQTIASLPANGVMPLSFPVVGKAIDATLPFSVQGSATSAARVAVDFNVNGLTADYVQIADSFVSFQKQFSNDYDLTDTLNVDYIDIADGEFIYIFHNYASYPLQVNINQLNLWKTPYCVQNSLVTLSDLGGASANDSTLYYFGEVTPQAFATIQAGGVLNFQKSNLSGLRLFPIWNPAVAPNGQSVARVVYIVENPAPAGKVLTMSAADSMLFTIRAPEFKFKQMAGTVMQAYSRHGDTERVAVPFPWNDSSKSSLRNNFILTKVFADIFMTSGIQDTYARIDTFNLTYNLYPTNNTSLVVTDSAKFLNVGFDSMYRHQTDMTSIINTFPDSMCIVPTLHIPVGTHVVSVNDLTNPSAPTYNSYMGEMQIKPITTVRMDALLAWQVVDTATLDLGTGNFKVPKAIRRIDKLDSLQVLCSMNILNQTNVYMSLYALAAPEPLIGKLDSLPIDSVWNLISNDSLARQEGYINLLSPGGILIPPRDSSSTGSISLNNWQINTLLSSDSASWRWEARFLPEAADALMSKDFIKVNSWMTLEGINNMDSLIIWK